jgi:hypothetical protein
VAGRTLNRNGKLISIGNSLALSRGLIQPGCADV